MRPRDSQRSKVYSLGRELGAKALELGTLRPGMSLQQIEDVAKTVFPRKTPEVRDGRGRRRAGGCAEYITMPKWSRDMVVVCHELAHTAMLKTHARSDYPDHGARYMQFYKNILVSLGVLPGHLIDELAVKHGVRIHKEEV